MADTAGQGEYVLYVFPFSLYSIMVRFAASLGELAQGSTPTIEKKLVNLHRNENISEWYLTSVSSKGQVPVLAGGTLPAPLAESLDISKWLCHHHFKGLLPEQFGDAIELLLGKLHQISGMALSVRAGPDEFPEGIPIDAVDELLLQRDISAEYRAALETKKNLHETATRWCVKPEAVLKAQAQAKELFAGALEQYKRYNDGGMWIFGDKTGPTLLDGHLVPFIVRLLETEQESLVPEELVSYAKRATDSTAYQNVTHGRSTLWNINYGHVHLLPDI